MLKMNFLCVFVLASLISSTFQEKRVNTLCDVTQWHTQMVEYIKKHDIDLRGWQSSMIRKLKHLVDEYGDRKVVKLCSFLDSIHSYILEESDQDEPDFNELDINNYKDDVVLDSGGEKLQEIQNHKSNELEEDEISVSKHNDQANGPAISDVNDKDGRQKVSNEETPGHPIESHENIETDVDPTDLSYLEDVFEEDDDSRQPDSSKQSKSGSDSSGQSESGSDGLGQSDSGSDSSGQSESGPDSSGQSDSELDSSGQSESGSDSSGQLESGSDGSGLSESKSDCSDQSESMSDSPTEAASGTSSSGQSETGSDSLGQSKTGSDSSGQSEMRSDNYVQSESGSNSSDESESGSDSSGQLESGSGSLGLSDSSGQSKTESDSSDQSKSGSDRPDKSATGTDSSGQSETRSDSSGQSETRSDNSGQSESGSNSSVQSESGSNISGQLKSGSDSLGQSDSSGQSQNRSDSLGRSEPGSVSSGELDSASGNSGHSDSGSYSSGQPESGTGSSGQSEFGTSSSGQSRSDYNLGSENSFRSQMLVPSNTESDVYVNGKDAVCTNTCKYLILFKHPSSNTTPRPSMPYLQGKHETTRKSLLKTQVEKNHDYNHDEMQRIPEVFEDKYGNQSEDVEIIENELETTDDKRKIKDQNINYLESEYSTEHAVDTKNNQSENEVGQNDYNHDYSKGGEQGQMEHNSQSNEQKQTISEKESVDDGIEGIGNGERNKEKDNSEKRVSSEKMMPTQINIPDISSLFKQQEQQTANKIDKLELNLLKLENNVLKQSKDAKDDVISIQHVQNHILKLENNLYQLNQSYNQLQRDHSVLKRKQKKQGSSLEMYHNRITSCQITQPKSENNLELITQQKSRIWELSQVVANQSLNIQHIQSRSTFLEEQNKHLFTMVIEQSALISNILSQIQEMNQRSASTKFETNELKLLFNQLLFEQSKEERSYSSVQRMGSDHSNGHENDLNHESVPTVPDSAFLPLESPANNIDGIRLEQGNQEHKGALRDGTVRQSEIPPLQNESDDRSVKAFTRTSDSNENIQIQDKDIVSDSSSPKNVEDNASNSGNAPSVKLTNCQGDKTASSTNNAHDDSPNLKNIVDQEIVKRHILYPPPPNGKAVDCCELQKKQGVESSMERVFVAGLGLSVSVKCDKAGGTGGWTTLLKRVDGQENFYRDYETYKNGFGSPRSEHYIGNEVVHYLTNQKHYSLRVDLTDWDGNTRHALYQHFWIDDENQHFKMHVHGYSGTAGDGLAKHNEMKFSTFDVDNDLLKKELGGSCAKRFKGAGWYYKCYQSNLMGVYYKGGIIPEKRYDGITWKPWKGPNYSMKSVTMSIRPREEE